MESVCWPKNRSFYLLVQFCIFQVFYSDEIWINRTSYEMLPLTSEHKLFVFLCHAKINRKFPHPFCTRLNAMQLHSGWKKEFVEMWVATIRARATSRKCHNVYSFNNSAKWITSSLWVSRSNAPAGSQFRISEFKLI